jgi:putative ABC transport system permease protein
VLIVATIIIYNQLGYIRNKKIGFNKEQVIHIKDAYVLDKQAETFKQEVLQFPEVVAGTKSGYLPVSSSSRSSQALFPDGKIENDKAVTTQLWTVDHDYIKTLGMQIISGRDFSKSFSTDSTAMVINEAASRQFGFGDNPVGKKITEIVDLDKKITRDFTVIGVVKNFNYESLRQNIGALCLRLEPDPYVISFRVKTGNMENTISHIRNTWKKMAPNEPFNYTFLNEEFDQMYRAEQRAGKIFMSFAALAILIACLGLFGLVTFAAEQRRKEIGIRKVLGASVNNIINMLSADFLKLVMIASVIAFPIAWYFMNQWLMNFAYRVNISWWVFAIAAVVALLIALVTVCIQAVKAAVSNPVKSLRSE